jgi:hypothetical protein
MGGGFYLHWKYPNTSRKLSKFVVICLIFYIPVYFLFISPPKKIIHITNLKAMYGAVDYFEIPSSHDKHSATVRLKKISPQFSFDMSGYSGSGLIENGDSVKILASTTELKKNGTSITSYELTKDDTFIFSLDKYNSSLADNLRLAKIFLWIAICFLALFILAETSGLKKWVEKKLSSGDKDFQANEPNFNEFLDR